MTLEHVESQIVSDKYSLTLILFYALGTVTQVPHFFFTTATDYWMYKFRDPVHASNRTGLQATFISTYSVVVNVSHVVFVTLALSLCRRFGLVRRANVCLVAAIGVFGLTLAFVEIDTDSWQFVFFVVTMAVVFFLTGLCTVFSITVLEMASRFPPDYLNAVLAGHSICGIFSAMAEILSLGIGANSKTSGAVYFFIGILSMFVTLAGFSGALATSKFFRCNVESDEEIETPKFGKEDVLRVLGKVKLYMASIVITIGSAAMVHPGVTSLVVSAHKGNNSRWNDVFFVPVVSFLLYNVFEYAGREIARTVKRPRDGGFILGLALCRLLFVPLVVLCNAQPRRNLPVIFKEDFAYIVIVVVFAMSTGFLLNLCVTRIFLVAHDENERKLCLVIFLVTLLVSLGLFSFVGAAIVKSL